VWEIIETPGFKKDLERLPEVVREYYLNEIAPLLCEDPTSPRVGRRIAGRNSTYVAGEEALSSPDKNDTTSYRVYVFFYNVERRSQGNFAIPFKAEERGGDTSLDYARKKLG
jgi:hypothetical protein